MPQGIKEGETQFNFKINRELLEEFKATAKARGESATGVLIVAINRYLGEQPSQPSHNNLGLATASDPRFSTLESRIAALEDAIANQGESLAA